jgi:predicted nucleotidyltransferase
MKDIKIKPYEAAKKFVEENFPECDAALLAGSVARGEETSTSDLDIVIIDRNLPKAYRESIIAFGWPIEVFVHNLDSCREFFKSDIKRARPSLPRMVAEGIILRDHEILKLVQTEAVNLIKEGPEGWTSQEVDVKRYFITDTLDDFIGTNNRAEELFIANTLAGLLHEFILRTNGRWIGNSKWIVRELKNFDPDFTEQFIKAFETFYKNGEKELVIKIAEDILKSHGGRLFEGFSIK